MPLKTSTATITTPEDILSGLIQKGEPLTNITKDYNWLLVPDNLSTAHDLANALLYQKLQLFRPLQNNEFDFTKKILINALKNQYPYGFIAVSLPTYFNLATVNVDSDLMNNLNVINENDVQQLTNVITQPMFLKELASIDELKPVSFKKDVPFVAQHIGNTFTTATYCNLLNKFKALEELVNHE